MRVLVTGGAGFVGANLASGSPQRHPDWEVIALDNLQRRGSELNLPRLRAAGVRFVHGDVRVRTTCGRSDRSTRSSSAPRSRRCSRGRRQRLDRSSARTSSAPTTASSSAAAHDAQVVFLSTSRVYPFGGLERFR